MEKLKNYHYKTDIANYITERFKIDKGVYNIKIKLEKEVIIEEENLEYKTGRDLEKYIRQAIKNYEKDAETEVEEEEDEDLEEDEEEDMEDAINDVLDEEDEEDEEESEDDEQKIADIFAKCKSPMEMKKLFEELDTEIRDIDGVIFKTTTADLVYKVNGQNFLRIRPKPKRLDILHAPDFYKDIIKLTDENEIDDVMVSIGKSCEYIKKKRSKK